MIRNTIIMIDITINTDMDITPSGIQNGRSEVDACASERKK